MSSSLRVVVFGHAYVRRLHDYALENNLKENLGFSKSLMDVRYVWLSGGTIERGQCSVWSKVREVRRLQPDILFFHIGENDVSSLHEENLADLLVELINRFSLTSSIIISRLLSMPCLDTAKVIAVNRCLEIRLKSLCNVVLWRHKGGFYKRFAPDGCHLTSAGMAAYWHSVRAVVGRQLKKFSERNPGIDTLGESLVSSQVQDSDSTRSMNDVISEHLTAHSQSDQCDVMMLDNIEDVKLEVIEIVPRNVDNTCELTQEDIKQEITTTFHNHNENNKDILLECSNSLMSIEVKNVFSLCENIGDWKVEPS